AVRPPTGFRPARTPRAAQQRSGPARPVRRRAGGCPADTVAGPYDRGRPVRTVFRTCAPAQEGEAVAVTEPDADDPYTRAPLHRPWPHGPGGQVPPYGYGLGGPGVPPVYGYPAPPPGYAAYP